MIKEIYSNLAELKGYKTNYPSDVALSYHLLSELCFLLLLSHQKRLEVRYFVARFLEDVIHPDECCWWKNAESFEKVGLVKFRLRRAFFSFSFSPLTHVLFYILVPNTYLLRTNCTPDIALNASVCFLWHNNLVSWFSSLFFFKFGNQRIKNRSMLFTPILRAGKFQSQMVN